MKITQRQNAAALLYQVCTKKIINEKWLKLIRLTAALGFNRRTILPFVCVAHRKYKILITVHLDTQIIMVL